MMKKGIWQEFDGYEDVIKQIEASRNANRMRSFTQDLADPYIQRLHPKRLSLRVVDTIQETASTTTLRLAPSGAPLPPFQAGQYISLFLDIDGIRTSRPYSISSPPNQIGYYDITVKRMPGGLASNFLMDRVAVDDVIESSGPQGHFYHNPLYHENNMVCIAGGSGITPFMSMIREIVECGIQRTFFLFYGNKQPDDVIFHQELTRTAQRFKRIHYIPVIEDPAADYTGQCGLISPDLIQKIVGDVGDKTFFLCGPQGLYDFCMPGLESMGIRKGHIRREMYGPPLEAFNDPAWPGDVAPGDVFEVTLKDGGRIQAPAGNPLLVSLEKGGIAPPSICRSGECSMCRVKVLSGSVFQPSGTPVRKSDRKYGYIHACVSYPLTDLEILV